ncbi:MAG: substrate-binding domain-containing protein [Planctomycetes bacterium]|nr:substrate-binding domain-containing protein [Planctomycetota bacterium]MBL7039692.1 substrate-binding domain-containing protein [Pirellulaceae bacterium]
MKCRKPVAACLLGIAAVVLASSCSEQGVPDTPPDSEPVPETKGVIGVTCMDMANPFFKLIAQVMEAEAQQYGYTILARSADLDPGKQDTQLADFVAQECDAIFLNPVDSEAVGQAVKKAHEAGIPVFTYDVQVTAAEATDLIVSHIGSDNFQGGRLAGESMMEVTEDKGEIAIITFPEVTSCIRRVDGFKDYLKKHNSKLKIVAELSGQGNRDGGLNVATDILQTHSDIIGIFAINDPSGLGAYAAISSEGKTDRITIVAFDASPAGKQAVFEKKLYDSPQQYPRKMAKGTVEAFIKYLDGEEVPKKTFIPCTHYYYEDSVNDESREKDQW